MSVEGWREGAVGLACDGECTARCMVGWHARQAVLKCGGGVYRLDRVRELLQEMAAGGPLHRCM